MKRILLAAALIAAGATTFLPSQADAQVGFTLEVGTPPPPQPRYEPAPPPRYGYQWVPGYWNWDGQGYVWVPGYWVTVREGYFFDAPHWVIVGGRWRLERGYWRHGRPPHYRGPRPYPVYHHPGPPPRHDEHWHGGHDGHDYHGGYDHHGDHDHHGGPDHH